jgi:pimeloyl-ACP methyl ester carboxylesterase
MVFSSSGSPPYGPPHSSPSFFTVGLSIGGAYALALAALAPERVRGAIVCCAMTDRRDTEARSTMSRPHALAVWDAPDRDAAIAAAVEAHGIDGSKIVSSNEGPSLPASDQAMLMSPWGRAWMSAVPAMFAQGLEGYADDRIEDEIVPTLRILRERSRTETG